MTRKRMSASVTKQSSDDLARLRISAFDVDSAGLPAAAHQMRWAVAEVERLRLAANSARVLIERHRATRGSNDLLTTALRELDEALER
jgi:hypothetical protein